MATICPFGHHGGLCFYSVTYGRPARRTIVQPPASRERLLLPANPTSLRESIAQQVRVDVWFSIAKGRDKTLDHIGKASAKKHRAVTLKQVLSSFLSVYFFSVMLTVDKFFCHACFRSAYCQVACVVKLKCY